MGQLSVIGSTLGEVLVSEELIELIGDETIDAAVGQLRLGGGHCRACDTTIHHVDNVSLVVLETAVGGRVSFVHLRCAPPQIIDVRRNRRASLAFERYFKERLSDVQAFAGVRSYPAPHAFLVVSTEATMAARTDNGDLVNPWLDLSLTNGFELLTGPDVFDVTPECLDGWSLRVDAGELTCMAPPGALYKGRLPMPSEWLDALASEGRCLVLTVGLTIDSDALGHGNEAAINMLATRGLVAAGTVKVTGSLGLHTAQGLGAALAEAERVEALTRYRQR